MRVSNITQQKYWLKIFLVSLLLTILFISGGKVPGEASAQGSAYYVAPSGSDSNPGTETQPWQTIQKAANTLVAGDTVYIRAGTYQEQAIPLNSGSPGNYITYAAYPGETVTIDGVSISLPAYETGLFVVEDRSYIRVSGLRIINAGPNDNNAGILVDNSHHIIIENNYTYNTVSSGIGVWNSNNIIIDGNEIELACNDGEQEDITVAGTDTFEIKNNHIHHGGPGTNGGEGIDAKDGSRNGKIYNNYVHHINGERTCLYVESWDKHTFNIEVYQNILHDCGAGISLASEMGGLLENVKVYNNIVYHNRSNGLEIGNWGEPGILVRPIENVTFINNTVYDNGSGTWGGGFFNENPDTKNIVVRNNIFSQNQLFQIANETTVPLTVDHNLIDGYREYADEIRGSDYVEDDPLFVNVSGADFHLQGNSPAIDKGSSVDAPSDDYEGNSRPQDGDEDGATAHDIGAYEVSLLGVPPPVTAQADNPTLLDQGVPTPPAGHIYHGVYPGEAIADSKPPPEDGIPFEEDGGTLDDLRSYEQHVGKTAAWVYFSHNWFRERSFPLSTASWIREAGSMPYIRLMLRSSSEQNIAEPTFTLDRIINGDFDDDLHTWAREARDFGSPLIVEYGTEANGEWFAWNGSWNGAGALDGYGDPAEYDGPERFRDAYRHIIQIAREEGASNITWVFHADAHDIPDEEWNRLELYYPGNEWIDWLGVSVYGALDPMDDEWPQFRDGMDAAYARLAALSPDKPIVLLEFGVTSGNPLGDQAEWAEAALTDLVALRWPRLIGFSWWNEFWQNDDDPSHDSILRVQGNSDLAAVFQRLVGDEPKVLGSVYQSATQTPAAEEPVAEEPATEEPEAETDLPILPAGPIVDNFEETYEPDQGWEMWADDQTDTSLVFTLDNEIAHSGSTSLRIEFDIAPEGAADVSRFFDPAQDWSDGAGLSMWLRFSEVTEGSRGMSVLLDSGEPESPTPFETWLEVSPKDADPSGWILVELPWDRFIKPDWADEGGLSEFDPSQVVDINLSFSALDASRVEGAVWVDDIHLLGEAPQSTLTEEAPTVSATSTEAAPITPPTPTAAPVGAATATEAPAPTTPPEEGGESKSRCPISLGLMLVGVALLTRRGSKKLE